MDDSMFAQNAEQLARRFHETYERLASAFGYETRRESAKPWEQVPENNRSLMIAVCCEILGQQADLFYSAYLMGCEDECIPEPLTKESFLSSFYSSYRPNYG